MLVPQSMSRAVALAMLIAAQSCEAFQCPVRMHANVPNPAAMEKKPMARRDALLGAAGIFGFPALANAQVGHFMSCILHQSDNSK
jgi:hypothetical protein